MPPYRLAPRHSRHQPKVIASYARRWLKPRRLSARLRNEWIKSQEAAQRKQEPFRTGIPKGSTDRSPVTEANGGRYPECA